MPENQNVLHEVYDDRNPSVVLFSHESSYVCSRYMDNERDKKGELLGSHLWFRTLAKAEV